jgi:hypothetical protein
MRILVETGTSTGKMDGNRIYQRQSFFHPIRRLVLRHCPVGVLFAGENSLSWNGSRRETLQQTSRWLQDGIARVLTKRNVSTYVYVIDYHQDNYI